MNTTRRRKEHRERRRVTQDQHVNNNNPTVQDVGQILASRTLYQTHTTELKLPECTAAQSDWQVDSTGRKSAYLDSEADLEQFKPFFPLSNC